MKKLVSLILMLSLSFHVYAGNQWQAGTGAETIPGSTNISDIDAVSFQNMTDPLDRLLTSYRRNCKITYLSASTLTVEAGELVVSNADGSIPLYLQNTSSTTVEWTDIDTGAEASSTTYYLYGYQDTPSDTDIDFTISTSSTTPTGITYYERLGSFYNDSSSNIIRGSLITNDNNYYGLRLGDAVAKTPGTAYEALTDGVVTAYCAGTNVNNVGIAVYVDSSNPPVTLVMSYSRSSYAGVSSPAPITYFVKKGLYYKVNITGTAPQLNWQPNE